MWVLEITSKKVLAEGYDKKYTFDTSEEAEDFAREILHGFYTRVKYWEGDEYYFNPPVGRGDYETRYFNGDEEMVGRVF